MTDPNQQRLIYFADPMCSWCWGFTPVIQQIARDYRDQVPIQMIMGGLYAGNTESMNASTKKDIRVHWLHVHEASGQPFNHDFFNREQFIYNTEPACRAMVACHQVNPDAVLAFLEHLQRAFYQANKDITRESELIRQAVNFGLDKAPFSKALKEQETQRITLLNFEYTRYLNVNGFPTLVGQSNNENRYLTRGYQPFSQLQPLLEQWLNRTLD